MIGFPRSSKEALIYPYKGPVRGPLPINNNLNKERGYLWQIKNRK